MDLEICAKTLTMAITQQPFKVFRWNLVHTLPETKRSCIARDIILDLIFIEIWLIFDFEKTDKRWRSLRGVFVNLYIVDKCWGKCEIAAA